ncbi:VOC family protein [Sphingomonas sp.]|uniref:VOC family protein n=1 Tax=Sphingomonas sp. TaxID=28214 RepID=UPI0025FB9E4D|nr:VOC family protein [Sphingomonas sp.]
MGIESLLYAVNEPEDSTRFFTDFGLEQTSCGEIAVFTLPEGSRVILAPHGHQLIPATSRVQGSGVHEVIWGVDTQESLDRLIGGLRRDLNVAVSDDGTARFVTNFGVAMGLRLFAKRPVLCAPDPVNAPGHVHRLNRHRKWRLRARPKVIAHVVFAVPGFEEAHAFMIERLNFRLSDSQRGFGMYLRADGANNHHNILLLNANAPIPGMDGVLRFHHANFGVEDIDEIMVGANYMARRGWPPSQLGLGRHRVDSALFYYLESPAGGEAEYGADSDYVDDSWVPRSWDNPLFAYSHFVHNLPPFLQKEPTWDVRYITGLPAGESH